MRKISSELLELLEAKSIITDEFWVRWRLQDRCSVWCFRATGGPLELHAFASAQRNWLSDPLLRDVFALKDWRASSKTKANQAYELIQQIVYPVEVANVDAAGRPKVNTPTGKFYKKAVPLSKAQREFKDSDIALTPMDMPVGTYVDKTRHLKVNYPKTRLKRGRVKRIMKMALGMVTDRFQKSRLMKDSQGKYERNLREIWNEIQDSPRFKKSNEKQIDRWVAELVVDDLKKEG
ncbi:MAG: hypothetical protein ACYSSM_04415 [Planctomycetota bacterium]|jgi:hypothetical protein